VADGPFTIPIFAINDCLSSWNARVECRVERLTACDVITGGRSTGAPRMMPPPEGSYALASDDAVVEVGWRGPMTTFESACPPSGTVPLGDIVLGHAPGPGPYRLVLEWQDDDDVERNTWTLLVTRSGWRAPKSSPARAPQSSASGGLASAAGPRRNACVPSSQTRPGPGRCT
jgi:hypothetical protein